MAPGTASSQGFRASRELHSTRMVNDRFPAPRFYGFEMVDALLVHIFIAINRKFTPNRIFQIFCEFSPNLLQCKHLGFIHDC
ncbi:hypothetical protein CQ12_27960 [Bradyrhizobium jicamae]|uniref:Uncharacterized protein n=1 Tax=Bradyrhizobium jicamae TaxID=280332 RepID=A0A0R3LWU4_9BRAD|nr:hypothetical protein CQ12_27960 [Bradyrhizobium jicamae]